MKQKILFYLPEGSINDATKYYIEILESSFSDFLEVVIVKSLKEQSNVKYILTIEAKHFFLAKLKFPKAKIINWFQGVVAEEALMTKGSLWRKYLWAFFESFTLKYSFFNIYVSRRMKKYFEDTYHISSSFFYIMPCFNKNLNLELINKEKYQYPTFVYAGSLATWQCVDKTLELYSLIERVLPNASLTLLTKEKELAETMVNNYKIKNYSIKYVSLENLDTELLKYKYGFLIRENHIVNNVATPTKMNSYLASGIIPIYSTFIEDFKVNFSEYDFIVAKEQPQDVLNDIVNFEKYGFNREIFFINLREIFDTYYNRKKYAEELSNYIGDNLIV